MAFRLSEVEGNRETQLGKYIGTTESTFLGKILAPANGAPFDATLYPQLDPIIPAGDLTGTDESTLITFPSASSSSVFFYRNAWDYGKTGDRIFALTFLSTSNYDFTLAGDLYGTPSVLSSPFSEPESMVSNITGINVNISDDGLKGYCLYVGATQWHSVRIVGTNLVTTSFPAPTLASGLGVVSDFKTCISSDGTVGYVFGEQSDNSEFLLKTTDGGATFTEQVSIGFPSFGTSFTPQLIACNSDGTTLYVVARQQITNGPSKVYKSTNSGGTLTEVFELGGDALPSGGKMFVDSTGNNVLIQGDSDRYTEIRPINRLYISSDGGTTFELCTTQGQFADKFGVIRHLAIVGVNQRVNGDLEYAVRRVDQGGALDPKNPLTSEYSTQVVVTSDRSPNWLSTGYASITSGGNFKSSEEHAMLGSLIDINETANKTAAYNQNGGPVIHNHVSNKFLPLLEGTKIIAEA